MALFKKDRREPVPPAQTDVHDTSVGTAADVEAVMKKYDRESNTRVWEGLPKLVIRWLMVAFSVYCIIDTVFLSTRQEVRLPVFVGLILLFGFLTFPARKGDERVNHMPWYDIVLLIAGPGAYFFYAVNAQNVVQMSARVMQNDLYMIIGLIGILALVELCRRCVGLPILCVAGVLLVYTFFNLGGTADLKMTLYQVIRTMFYTFNGIFGGPISVCAKFIVVFIIFGAFLERTGIAQFFINLANAVAGAAPGGPAKVAVISSALCGMVSGSSVGNTVTTGSVTIPMMKKTGYKPEFAGAVEAAASTGGQIMPPIMGAAAFLMAEFTGEPYGTIAMRAILPAVLYFTGIYIAVHLEAKKLGLKGIPRDQLPRIRQLLPKIYLLAPLVLLVVMVSTNMYTMAFSAAIAIVAAVAVGLINNVVEIAGKSGDRSDFLTFGKIVDALEGGAKGSITVAVACGVAGIISGCITVTGLASKLLSTIVSLSGGHMIIALVLTMLCCIVLGMGVPTTANYCIMAATCAPILMDPSIGVTKMAAHFFVFYFGIVADITPPVALAAYAGSAIAKADPMKTGFNATKLAIAAFIVPYIFAFSPQMLFVDVTGTFQVVQICISALLGIFGVAAALNGFLYRPVPVLLRLLLAIGGLGMMIPGTASDIAGFVLVVGIVLYQRYSARRTAAA
ncbi:TRAP transporter permease [Oscillibacter valericigenes]|uniref:TRAP transporter permease n=1 Tax=Oscillibacter valericigenes TaxID=351091 RepID=A0ABS2FYM9_9FIRM|nr:TRAP transporter permease [Oscillibacter valericigenes]MBM6852428.1 TRAP transporter permease [Oscillibacter valericigenes]MBM6910173.1 TRAP transporter permease [Oscillibacter valericigenes]HJB77855.1 TRAP transporter permease [Candidatus Oscillibacter avistercoris]